MMPADRTDVAVVAYLDPSAGQKVNLLRMADRFPALGDREELTGRLHTLLDRALQPVGLDSGVLDWVGVEAAVAVDLDLPQDANVAVMIDTDDEEAAATDLETVRASTSERGWASSEHNGIEVWSTTTCATRFRG